MINYFFFLFGERKVIVYSKNDYNVYFFLCVGIEFFIIFLNLLNLI